MKEMEEEYRPKEDVLIKKIEGLKPVPEKVSKAITLTRRFLLADPYSVFEKSEKTPPLKAFRWLLYTGPKLKPREWFFRSIYRGLKTRNRKEFFESAPKYVTERFLIVDFARDEDRAHQVAKLLEDAAEPIEQSWEVKQTHMYPSFITPEGLVGLSVNMESGAAMMYFERRDFFRRRRLGRMMFPYSPRLRDDMKPELSEYIVVAHELTHKYLDDVYRQKGKDILDGNWVSGIFWEGVAEATAIKTSGLDPQAELAWSFIVNNHWRPFYQFFEKDNTFPIPGDPRLLKIKGRDARSFYTYHLAASLSDHLLVNHGTRKFLEFMFAVHKAKKLSQVEKQLNKVFGYKTHEELAQEWWQESLRPGFEIVLKKPLTDDDVKHFLKNELNDFRRHLQEQKEKPVDSPQLSRTEISQAEITTPKLAKDILNIDSVQISPHALQRFALRLQLGLVEAAGIIRARLGQSQLIEEKDLKKVKPKINIQGNERYFRDSIDEDIIYIVSKKKNGKKEIYQLATILRPLRHSKRTGS